MTTKAEKDEIRAMFREDQKPEAHSPLDIQIGGDHYKNMAIQPLEFFIANSTPFAEASICKYVLRHNLKGKRQDLEKAKHLIDVLISKKYEGSNE